MLGAIWRSPRMRREEEAVRARARGILERVGLKGWADHPAESLPTGLQRIPGIPRALAAFLQLVLMDEPGAGLNPFQKARLAERIRQLHQERITVLPAEHDMNLVMELAEEIAVLDDERLTAEAPPEATRQDPWGIAAYRGAEEPPHVAGG